MRRTDVPFLCVLALFFFVTAGIPSSEERYEIKESSDGKMVFVPAGEFIMGCANKKKDGCDDDEKPDRRIYLDDYYMDKYEVTVNDFAACVDSGACEAPTFRGYCNWSAEGRGDHPMNCVDWFQAKAYCKWAGKRLPTEAEWEKAARGVDGRKYPWGDEVGDCDRAVMSPQGWDPWGCGKNETAPRGSRRDDRSPYGAYDMAGNVWEWTSDYYAENRYRFMSSKNPEGPGKGKYRVHRGGSWCFNRDYLRLSNRAWQSPIYGDQCGGFRCARKSAH